MITTIKCDCSECGNPFDKVLSYVKRSKTGKHYCTTKCQYISRNKAFVKSRENIREQYEINPKKCLCCDGPIGFENRIEQSFCSRSCSATYNQKDGYRGVPHKWTDEEKRIHSEKVKNSIKFIIGNKRVPHQRVGKYKICPICEKSFYQPKCGRKICCSMECAKIRGMGGFREKSGTSKKGWYKGIWCGSSWELAWVIYHIEKQIPFSRNSEGFKYNFDGKDRKYYPDFKVGEQYIEIKGYKKEDVDSKVNQFPKDKKLVVLYKNDLKEIFDYVYLKYGKNIHELYDK